MSAVLDHLGIKLLEVGVASLAVLGPSALALVVLRQPARRRLVARLTWVTLVALIPLAMLDLTPRWDALRGLRLASSPFGGLHPPEGLRPWLRAGAVAYLIGVAISLAWLALILFLGEWIVWSARPASGPTRARLDELAKGMGIRTPQLRVSGRFALPGVLGMLRPTIVLPESWDDRPEDEGVTLALLHELAHLASGDRVFTLLGRVVQAFWFPIPAMGWLIEQHKRDQEVLADGRAARHFGTARGYATRLVGLVEQEAARGTPSISVGGNVRPARGAGGGSGLFDRILMLVRSPFPLELSAPRRWRYAGLCAFGLAAVFASGASLRVKAPCRPAEPRRLALESVDIAADQEGPIFAIPSPLPDRFEARMEVWADSLADLRRMELMGCPLDASGISDGPGWRLVLLRREGAGCTLRVDGRLIAVADRAEADRPWLSFEARPGKLGRIRDLVVTW